MHSLQRARSEYHTQLANVSFDVVVDLTTGLCFYLCIFAKTRQQFATVLDLNRSVLACGCHLEQR